MTTREGVYRVLKILGLDGVMGTTVTASNSYEAFVNVLAKHFPSNTEYKFMHKEMLRQKLINISGEDSSTFRISLTPKGALKLIKLNVDKLSIKPMKSWDKQWRIVCFDIPSGKDSERLYFNRRLHELGFTMLQRSMWVHPYDCFSVVKDITDYCNLTRYVSIIEVARFDVLTTKKLLRAFENLSLIS